MYDEETDKLGTEEEQERFNEIVSQLGGNKKKEAVVEKVYICLPHCGFFHGEDGCGHNGADDEARYEMKGDYPLCPLYEDRVEEQP